MQRAGITKAFQWDLARQVERLDFLLKWLPRYAEWGYQELYLHLEDAIEYPSLPAVARPDAYSYAQLGRLVEAASAVGIRVVPIVNLLGHTQYLIKVPELRDLNELRNSAGDPLDHGQICPLHPDTLEIAEKLLRDVAPFCTAGKVHVGLDESFHLGKCRRCRADVTRRGLAGHFAGHVNRLHQLTEMLGLRMGLWADMLALLPATIPQLPRGVIAYDWYYYPFARHPRVELYNFAEVDLATPLQKQGIEYWGCPMNGAFRHEPLPIFGERLENIRSWWQRCQRVGAGGFLITSWEANRLAIELTTAVDAAAACLWLDPEVDDPREMLAHGFGRVFGRKSMLLSHGCRNDALGRAGPLGPPGNWARAALACDQHPFAGYHRWQINDRWDVLLTREPLSAYEKEARALERLCRSHLGRDPARYGLQAGSYNISPPALHASMAFRFYLAQRDVFVRRCAQAVFKLRRQVVRSAGLQPALSGGTGPLALDPSHPDEEVHATQSGLKLRATLNQLRAEAAIFAATLHAGRAAARIMWKRSRNPHIRGPNELMLDRDAQRLREWRLWLRRTALHPELIWLATPVCGAWQLSFVVHNFAPALQKVVVEQQQPDGSWRTVHGMFTIEFQAFAARPRTRIHREVSAPIDDPSAPLRLAVRGAGQVAVSHLELTDGVTRLRPPSWRFAGKRILGLPTPGIGTESSRAHAPAVVAIADDRPAKGMCRPTAAFPEIDWSRNQDELLLTFSKLAG